MLGEVAMGVIMTDVEENVNTQGLIDRVVCPGVSFQTGCYVSPSSE